MDTEFALLTVICRKDTLKPAFADSGVRIAKCQNWLKAIESLEPGKHSEGEGESMSIWTVLFIILLIAWLGGFTVFHVASGLIHLLLVFAVISLILHFIVGRRTV